MRTTTEGLVKVVDVLRSRGHDPDGFAVEHQVHQVEEVAALLHQRPDGVFGESIPVSHLVQKGEPVLTHPEHLGRPTAPSRTSSIRRDTGGMNLYSRPIQMSPERPCDHSITRLQSATVVRNGFSMRT